MRHSWPRRRDVLTSEAGWAFTPGFGPYNLSKAAPNTLGASPGRGGREIERAPRQRGIDDARTTVTGPAQWLLLRARRLPSGICVWEGVTSCAMVARWDLSESTRRIAVMPAWLVRRACRSCNIFGTSPTWTLHSNRGPFCSWPRVSMAANTTSHNTATDIGRFHGGNPSTSSDSSLWARERSGRRRPNGGRGTLRARCAVSARRLPREDGFIVEGRQQFFLHS